MSNTFKEFYLTKQFIISNPLNQRVPHISLPHNIEAIHELDSQGISLRKVIFSILTFVAKQNIYLIRRIQVYLIYLKALLA